MINFTKTLAAATVGLGMMAGSAFAQDRLVEVDVGGIANDLTVDLTVSGNTVQVPIGIAANVCAVANVGVLAKEFAQGGSVDCDAQTTSKAFENYLVESGQAERTS